MSLRPPTLWWHNLCLKKLCMVIRCTCLGPRHSTYSNYLSVIAAVEIIISVFSYDAMLFRDSNLSPSQQWAVALSVTPQSRLICMPNPAVLNLRLFGPAGLPSTQYNLTSPDLKYNKKDISKNKFNLYIKKIIYILFKFRKKLIKVCFLYCTWNFYPNILW